MLRALPALLVAISLFACRRDEPEPRPPPLSGRAEMVELLAGLRQDGPSLGEPTAPVVLVEFLDLECPFCRLYAAEVLPIVIERYVRPGRVRLELRLLAFLGEDSVEAARLALAAGEQDRMWHVVDLFLRNQSDPSIEDVDDARLLRLAAEIPGLDAERAMRARDAPEVRRALEEAATLARRHDVVGVPAFLAGRRGEPHEALVIRTLRAEELTRELDRLLAAPAG